MNQPRDANGCFSRRAAPRGASISGADGSSSAEAPDHSTLPYAKAGKCSGAEGLSAVDANPWMCYLMSMTEALDRPQMMDQSVQEIFSDPKTALGQGVKMLKGGGGIFKSAAVTVLRQDRRLLTTAEITKLALERQHIKCQGRTPEATMASALYTDVKRKGNKSVFTRPQEGLFGLREWKEEGFVPEAVPGHPQPQPLTLQGMQFELSRGPWRANSSAEDQAEETSDLAEIQSMPPAEADGVLESPSPLLRVQTPMGKCSGEKDAALQLLGEVCLRPAVSTGCSTPCGRQASAGGLNVKTEVQGPGSARMGSEPDRAARPKSPDLLQASAHERIRTLSSPLQLDRLAMFHDIVTSPAGVARLAEVFSPGGNSGAARKKPRLELDIEEMDAIDLDQMASLARCSPSTSAFLAGFLPSAQNLPRPLYASSPVLADISPLPFAMLHCPESAAPHRGSSTGLTTPTMISLAFGDDCASAEAPGTTPAAVAQQQVPEQAQHLQHAAMRLPNAAFSFAAVHVVPSQPNQAVRHERLPPPLVLPGAEEVPSEPRIEHCSMTASQSDPAARAAQPARAGADASRKPTQEQGRGLSTSDRLQRIEAKVRQMEHTLGLDNPQVGKAWLYLSKAYQNYGAGADADQAKEKSEAALFRSFQCMQACSSLCTAFFDACPSADPVLPPALAENVDFAYLLSNMRSLQPQQH